MARLGRGQPNRPIITRTRAGGPGTGSISIAFALAGSGIKHAAGTGSISLTLALAGGGVKHATGTGAPSLTLALSSTGTKQSGIGTPPRPRTRWQLVQGPATGGHELALTEATGRRYTAKLTEPSDLSYGIDARHSQALAIDELSTDTHLLWASDSGTTQIVDRLRVGSTQDTFSEDTHTVAVTCLDYRAMLARRRLKSTDTLTYAATDQAEIAWGLVASTQAHTNGALGISKGWTGTSPTSVTRDRTYEAGDSVGERVQELSEVIGGFDWDVTPVSASGLELDVWYSERGVDRGVVLEYGGLVATGTRDANPADYANAIRYTGSAGDDVTPGPNPVESESPLLAGALQGRWDAVFGDDGLITQAALDDRAAWQLAQSEVVSPVYTVVLRRGSWDGPEHIWLGDPVRLVIRSGRLDVDTSLRVYEVQITLDGDGGEAVELTLGGRRPDYRRTASLTDRRLKNLERR